MKTLIILFALCALGSCVKSDPYASIKKACNYPNKCSLMQLQELTGRAGFLQQADSTGSYYQFTNGNGDVFFAIVRSGQVCGFIY